MIKTILLLFLLVFILSGCQSVSGNEELIKAIEYYYENEKSKNWNVTYKLRNKKFRDAIEFPYYRTVMNEDYRNWVFLDYKIININANNNRAKVTLLFKENPSDEYRKSHLIPETVQYLTIEDDSYWLMEEEMWKCISPGSRYVLKLNSKIAE